MHRSTRGFQQNLFCIFLMFILFHTNFGNVYEFSENLNQKLI
jgi:hypothetical protein